MGAAALAGDAGGAVLAGAHVARRALLVAGAGPELAGGAVGAGAVARGLGAETAALAWGALAVEGAELLARVAAAGVAHGAFGAVAVAGARSWDAGWFGEAGAGVAQARRAVLLRRAGVVAGADGSAGYGILC